MSHMSMEAEAKSTSWRCIRVPATVIIIVEGTRDICVTERANEIKGIPAQVTNNNVRC
jgi:hypothetical protein